MTHDDIFETSSWTLCNLEDVEFSRAICEIIFSAYVTSIVSSSIPMQSGEHQRCASHWQLLYSYNGRSDECDQKTCMV